MDKSYKFWIVFGFLHMLLLLYYAFWRPFALAPVLIQTLIVAICIARAIYLLQKEKKEKKLDAAKNEKQKTV